MPSVQIIAVFEQFPWLAKHFNQNYIFRANVSRMDVEFLEKRRYKIEKTYSGGVELSHITKIFLYDQNGDLLTTWEKLGMLKRFFFNETIESTLRSLGTNINECGYAVEVLDGFTITVYRLPKNGTFADLLEMKKQAIADVRKEIEES